MKSISKYNPPLRREDELLESIELPLTIQEVADQLGICEEAARAIVTSTLQASQISLRGPLALQSLENKVLPEI